MTSSDNIRKNINNHEFSIVKYVKSDNLLNLWLIAYFEKRIKKKQLINLDIKSSIKEIIDILSAKNEWIPLRISSGLLSGIVKVYCHKVEYLNNKCNNILTKMQNYRSVIHNETTIDISNKDNNRSNLGSDLSKLQASRVDQSAIDIEEISKTLEIMNDDSIDQLEIVPLSQINKTDIRLVDKRIADSQKLNNFDSEPILLDMEFDDFVDQKNDFGMDIEGDIEKLRGESIDFEDVLARGLEEIDSGQRKKIIEIRDRDNDSIINEDEFSRKSIDIFNSTLSNGNRNSIGALSTLEFVQDEGNRLSMSVESDRFFEGNMDEILLIDKKKVTEDIKLVNEASLHRIARKKRKITNIPLDKELKLSYLNSSDDRDNLRKLNNLIIFSKNSNIDIFSINNISRRDNYGFLLNLINKKLSIGFKKNFDSKKNSLVPFNVEPPKEHVDYFYNSENNIDLEEFNANIENLCIQTPTRGKKMEENEQELMFTPWTKYLGSEQRNTESLHRYVDNEKIMESLFSSRENKTMNYLKSKFSKNKCLNFDELVKDNDPSVIAPIFVQILHLKSKSMINIEQKEPFGKIFIYPV